MASSVDDTLQIRQVNAMDLIDKYVRAANYELALQTLLEEPSADKWTDYQKHVYFCMLQSHLMSEMKSPQEMKFFKTLVQLNLLLPRDNYESYVLELITKKVNEDEYEDEETTQ